MQEYIFRTLSVVIFLFEALSPQETFAQDPFCHNLLSTSHLSHLSVGIAYKIGESKYLALEDIATGSHERLFLETRKLHTDKALPLQFLWAGEVQWQTDKDKIILERINQTSSFFFKSEHEIIPENKRKLYFDVLGLLKHHGI